MARRNIISKHKQDLFAKLNELKSESNNVIKYVESVIDRGMSIASELETETDQVAFLERYPAASRRLDELLNKLVRITCSVGLVDSDDEFEGSRVEWPISEGDILDMCFLQGNSPYDFWLRYYSTKPLDQMRKAMHSRHIASRLRPYDATPGIGTHVCAVIEDERLIRAKVFGVREGRLVLLDLDSGARREVAEDHAFALDEDMAQIPAQALHCRLKGDPALWDNRDASKFREMMTDSTLVVTICRKLEGDPPQFLVEIDCHKENRKIELAQWVANVRSMNPQQFPESKNLVCVKNPSLRQQQDLYSYIAPVMEPSICKQYHLTSCLDHVDDPSICQQPQNAGTFLDPAIDVIVCQQQESPDTSLDLEEDPPKKQDLNIKVCPIREPPVCQQQDLCTSSKYTQDSSLCEQQNFTIILGAKEQTPYEQQDFNTKLVLAKDSSQSQQQDFSNNLDPARDSDQQQDVNTKLDPTNEPTLYQQQDSNTKLDPVKNPPEYQQQDLKTNPDLTENIYLCEQEVLLIKQDSVKKCPLTQQQTTRSPLYQQQDSNIKLDPVKNPSEYEQQDLKTNPDLPEEQEDLRIRQDSVKERHVAQRQTTRSPKQQELCVETKKDTSKNYQKQANPRSAACVKPASQSRISLKQPVTLSTGVIYSALLAHIEDPGEFYIHTVCFENTQINSLTTLMDQHYNSMMFNPASKREAKQFIGTVCAAFFEEDQHWYRAQILDWCEASDSIPVCIQYVDYGNRARVHFSLLRPLDEMFTEVPICAQQCHLAKIHPTGSTPTNILNCWSDEATNLFKCLINVNCLYCVVVLTESEDKHSNSLPVLLQDWQDGVFTIVNKRIVDYGYAINFSPLENPEPLEDWDPMAEDYYATTNTQYHDDEDASYVVTGYKPQDERRVCKFFAEKGYCFKGETCLRTHSYLHPDGWTTDKEMIFTDAFKKLSLPNVGEEVLLSVTNITHVNVFHAVIFDAEEEENLLSLINYLNEEQNIKALRRLTIMPALGQIVIARYSKDGCYYRARVVDFDETETEDRINVFYVDYGNSEWVRDSDIRDIESRYLHLPFQAVECVLANINDISDNIDGVQFFSSQVYNKGMLKARIIARLDHLSRLEVLLKNENDKDVGELIIKCGYGEKRTFGTSVIPKQVLLG
ncbi:uncharacterized protein [Periplaneta americana]|uniref:uncharacterized protein n=1 Tax=Periplaneta americana TaxID=6978 RepID=UPI0037E75C56